MVLDTVKEITEDDQSPGYEVGDYMLIFKNTYDGEEKGKFRKVTMNAKDKNAPNFSTTFTSMSIWKLYKILFEPMK